MAFSRYVCVRAVCCVALLAVALTARAEYEPGFDLDTCCEVAKTIALGEVAADNEFRVKEFLFGGSPETTTLPLAAEYAVMLRTALKVDKKAPIEALIFLNEEGQPVLNTRGVVGFHQRDVAIVDYALGLEPTEPRPLPGLHPKLTRDDVLGPTRQLIALVARRRELLALPRSAAPTDRMLDLLREDMENRREWKLPHEFTDYQVRVLAEKLRPLDLHRESSIIRTMCAVPPEMMAWRIRLLKFCELVPVSSKGFEAVGNWIGRDNPRELRVASIGAMARVNGPWAAERLAPLLSLDDDCLPHILGTLCCGLRGSRYWLHNPRVVDALEAFIKEVRERKVLLHDKRNNSVHPLMAAIKANFHPRLLPLLMEWATHTDDPTSGTVAQTLSSSLGFKSPDSSLDRLVPWWSTARATLERDYNLSQAQGVLDWLAAYEKSDKPTRQALDALWLFEPRANESTLLSEAKSDQSERAASAKNALRTLWKLGFLSPHAKKQIAEDFLNAELVEIPAPNAGTRELQFVLHCNFPLPRLIEVQSDLQSSVGFSKDGAPVILRDSMNSRDAQGEGKLVLGSLGGGGLTDPTARFAFAVSVFDSQQREVVFTRRWDFTQKDIRKETPKE